MCTLLSLSSVVTNKQKWPEAEHWGCYFILLMMLFVAIIIGPLPFERLSSGVQEA